MLIILVLDQVWSSFTVSVRLIRATLMHKWLTRSGDFLSQLLEIDRAISQNHHSESSRVTADLEVNGAGLKFHAFKRLWVSSLYRRFSFFLMLSPVCHSCSRACLRIPEHHLGASSYQPVSGKSLLAIVIAPLRAPNQCKRLRPGTKTQKQAGCACWLLWLSGVGLQLQTHPAPTAQLWTCT